MIELFGMGSPNVIKIVLMLEEVGLPYEIRRVEVVSGEQNDPAFRALNPNGKVPVLVDHDAAGGPLTLFESGAILIYLAEKTGQLLPSDIAGRFAVLQWLMLQMAGIGPTGGQAIHFSAVTRTDSYARGRFGREKDRLLDLLEQRLAACPFVAGEAYSIADIAIFPWVKTLQRFFRADPARSALDDWMARLRARPAVQRSEAIGDALSAQDRQGFATATQDQLDRYFGRGPD